MIDPDGLVYETLLDEDTIQARIAELAGEITRDYRDREPLVVCVLKGGFIFLADLVRHLDMPVNVDFMAISSYGAGTARAASCASSRTWRRRSRGARCWWSRTSSTPG